VILASLHRDRRGILIEAWNQQILVLWFSRSLLETDRAHGAAILGSLMIEPEGLARTRATRPVARPIQGAIFPRSAAVWEAKLSLAALLQSVYLDIHSLGEVCQGGVVWPDDPGGGQEGLVER
jgi:hypothetical protein